MGKSESVPKSVLQSQQHAHLAGSQRNLILLVKWNKKRWKREERTSKVWMRIGKVGSMPFEESAAFSFSVSMLIFNILKFLSDTDISGSRRMKPVRFFFNKTVSYIQFPISLLQVEYTELEVTYDYNPQTSLYQNKRNTLSFTRLNQEDN